MIKDNRWVRIVADSVASNVMESILRNNVENSAGLSVKISKIVRVAPDQNPSRTHPMLADALES